MNNNPMDYKTSAENPHLLEMGIFDSHIFLLTALTIINYDRIIKSNIWKPSRYECWKHS
jgi:hypothetical protein